MLSATSATTRSRQGAAPARPRNVGAIIVQNDVDLAHLEAGDFQIELRRQFEDLRKLQDERLAVQAESSVIRLSASRSARSSASGRSVTQMAGTSVWPNCRAACT